MSHSKTTHSSTLQAALMQHNSVIPQEAKYLCWIWVSDLQGKDEVSLLCTFLLHRRRLPLTSCEAGTCTLHHKFCGYLSTVPVSCWQDDLLSTATAILMNIQGSSCKHEWHSSEEGQLKSPLTWNRRTGLKSCHFCLITKLKCDVLPGLDARCLFLQDEKLQSYNFPPLQELLWSFRGITGLLKNTQYLTIRKVYTNIFLQLFKKA